MIFRKEKIKRMASELLAKELLKTPNFHFTNASYSGYDGEVLGTIEMKKVKQHEEWIIQYCLKQEGGWESSQYNLVKYLKVEAWIPKHFESGQVEVVATYYLVTDDVYSDNKEEARQARILNMDRYNRKSHTSNGSRTKQRIIPSNTKLYDALFTRCAKEKNIKYGTEIKYKILYRDDYRYAIIDNVSKSIGITHVITEAEFIYRKQPVRVTLNQFDYDNPHANYRQ